MQAIVGLLRAVNLGGHNRIAMPVLKELCEGIGARDARTCLQSGNVVLRAPQDAVRGFGRSLERAIAQRLGFQTAVIVRTARELEEAAAANPFAGRADFDPARLLVVFPAAEPQTGAAGKLANLPRGREELRLGPRELYVYFPHGIGRSKLAPGAIERALGVTGTGRNWNTVRKLLAMVSEASADAV